LILDHDDTLAAFALFEIVKCLNDDPSIDFIYSDEDKITVMEKKDLCRILNLISVLN